MADIEHVDITDPNIHEPKGASSASANTIYRANGSGSGAWVVLTSTSLDMTEIEEVLVTDAEGGSLVLPAPFYLTGVIADVSTAGSIIFSIPDDCTILGASLTLGDEITVADANISIKDSLTADLGTAAVIGFSGSAKGTTVEFAATSNNELTGPTWIEVVTDGGSTGTVPLYITIKGVK